MANVDGVTVQSVSRAIEIIACFESDGELGIKELSEQMCLSKSTIYGLVNTLVKYKYLEQSTETKRYRLGIKLFELGNIVQKRMDLREEAMPYCRALSEKFHATVHLAAHYDDEIVYIDKVDIPDDIITYSQVGKRLPMYCTAVGKAILAYLPLEQVESYCERTVFRVFTEKTLGDRMRLLQGLEAVQKLGYAVDDEEYHVGLRCVAAPIFNYKGIPIAAVSVSQTMGRMSAKRQKEIAAEVTAVAAQISCRMGYREK